MSEYSNKPPTIVSGLTAHSVDDTGYPERRGNPRFTFTASEEIFDLRSHTRIVGRCSDLGPSGCYIDTLCPLAVGASVRVRIERELREFEAMAVVAYSRVPMGMGLAFTEIRAEHQDVLQTWIRELSTNERSEPRECVSGPDVGMLSSIMNLRQTLNELISLLVRKKVLTEAEGSGLSRQIFR